jgi:serine phosphatase RsbU (regulator of sigma subunit)/Tfp pilus assembly protein PilF
MRGAKILGLLLLSSFYWLNAQLNPVDSLKNIFATAKHDTIAIQAYLHIGEQVYLDQPDTAVYYWNKAKKLSESSLTNKSYNKTTLACITRLYANILNDLAIVFSSKGDIKKSLEYYFQSIKSYEKTGDALSVGILCCNIGGIYFNQNQYKSAEEYFLKAIEIGDSISDKIGLANAHELIGVLYGKTNRLDESQKHLELSLALNKEVGNKYGEAYSYNDLGVLNQKKNEFPQAIKYYLASIRIREEIKDLMGLCNSYTNVGKLYYAINKKQEAEQYMKKALEIGSKVNFPENIRDASGALYQFYKREGNYKEALMMFEKYIITRDTIDNIENNKAAIEEKIQYDYDKKAIADSIRTADEKRIISAELKQEKTVRWALFLGLALAALFAIFIFNRFKISQKQKAIIENQKQVVEEKQKEIIDSINYAKRIQYALLANENTLQQNLPQHFVFFKPKDIVSGDFYWAMKKEDAFYLAVCDCTGHGVPGAFMSLLNTSSLNEAISEKNILDPDKVLNYLRRRLIESISQEGAQDGMDGILIRLSGSKQFHYAAANNKPLIIRNGLIMELNADKMAVGRSPKEDTPFSLFTEELHEGDMLYLYTDGFADQFGGPKGKKFKYKRLNELLASISALSVQEQELKLTHHLADWKGDLEQVDDICIIGIRI